MGIFNRFKNNIEKESVLNMVQGVEGDYKE